MYTSSRIAFICVNVWIWLAAPPALGADPTETMRAIARMLAALEARDMPGYCDSRHSAAYRDYLSRVCHSAVQNRLKTAQDCSAPNIALQSEREDAECRAMPVAEFERLVLRGRDGRKAFIDEMTSQGIDGERLLQQERGRRP